MLSLALFIFSAGISLKAGHRVIWLAMRTILSSWFDYLVESFCYKEFQIKYSSFSGSKLICILQVLVDVVIYCTMYVMFNFYNLYISWNTVEPSLWLRPPLLSDQFSKIPKVSKLNYYIWNLLLAGTSCKQPQKRLEL